MPDGAGGPVFVRYQSPVADERGRHIGVFGLVNMLGLRGRLTEVDEAWRVQANAWYDAAYTNPSLVDPHAYDDPATAAWFKAAAAAHLVEPVELYLELLGRYGVACVRVESDAVPGRVVYEDEFQVVVVPA
jgi:hypothetical protein